MARYSHSKLSTFEQCKLRYKYRYIDKIPVSEKSIEAFLGTIVHDTLELIYKKAKENILMSINEIVIYFTTQWEKNFDYKNTKIVKQHLSQKDYFNMGIKFLLDYYLKHQPFQDGTIETEKQIILTLDELKNTDIVGYIDRLVYNKEKNSYEIHDYKTAGNLPSKEKIEADRQLALYSIAIKKEFGEDKEICLIWHYLSFNKKICITKTKEQLQELRAKIVELIKIIESTKKFPSKKSILCDWCEYKNRCPEFNPQQKLF